MTSYIYPDSEAQELFDAQKAVNLFNERILQVPTGTYEEVSWIEDRRLQPRLLDGVRMHARISHLQEEQLELAQAYIAGDICEVADGLMDLIYIALGTLSEMHVDASRVFHAVHQANMAKVNGTVAKRPNAGNHDAVKPEGWKAPDIHKAIYGE
ncbi:hypothetical protein Axy16_040 [Achromobacter phage vB_AxyS_19-32_Axy16]|nr:hypothetical protein Axy06_038 [Achromobacter phage vB_AxyS_19-32_Axy06]QDH84316.1 hypothetical protein Axy16_040 [Achromobacter phage vB_AxyS_19-32_Axy16]QIW86463.1 phosphoribosyl-ATP pyrophosphohydrolase [Achromobacter phage AMA1]